MASDRVKIEREREVARIVREYEDDQARKRANVKRRGELLRTTMRDDRATQKR